MKNETGQRKLDTIAIIMLLGFMAALAWHYWQGAYLGKSYPFNTFLYTPEFKFSDFTDMLIVTKDRNPYFCNYIFQSGYFPFANMLLWLFSLLPPMTALWLYIVLYVGPLWGFIYLFTKKLGNGLSVGAVVLGTMSYPFLYTLDRGNSEGLLSVCLLAFLWFLYRKDNEYLSSLFLACAIAMKAYPLVFLFLLLGERRYRAILLTMGFAAVLSISSLMLHQGDFIKNLQPVLHGFGWANSYNFTVPNKMQAGVSLFVMLKALLNEIGYISRVNLIQVNHFYTIACVLLFIPVAAYVAFLKVETWKKVLLLTLAMLLFPQVSCDYKLQHLFLPLLLFVTDDSCKTSPWLDRFVVCCFGVLLMPITYYYFSDIISENPSHDLSIKIFVKPTIMAVLLMVVLSQGFVAAYRGLRAGHPR